MATNSLLLSDLAIPPGETLAEELETRGLSQAELARRMRRPAQAINEIIHGRKAITVQTALQIEDVLGVPAIFWLNLELRYQLTLATRQREVERLARTKDKPRKRAA